MDFEKIMQQITSGLTGDGEKDIKRNLSPAARPSEGD